MKNRLKIPSREANMPSNKNDKKKKQCKSAFNELGFKGSVELLIEEIRELYLSDRIPWVIGYSGGKDSTAIVQLVWLALLSLEPEKRLKRVYIISTDTLVENPIVSTWVTNSLKVIEASAQKSWLPITTHRLTPKLSNSFWVNLLGRGYPAPRPKFRWCTDRLKISPSSEFISNLVRKNGEAIVVLGSRKAESVARARVMKKHEAKRTRKYLSKNANLPNSFVYTPIENWSNDDVWVFLLQMPNPWGFNNKELLTLYQGASEGGECPLVIDTSTPSCGDSRFGCWVCTMVDKDKSMAAMIQNDEEKEWMLPLLKFRDEIGKKDDRHLRDFRRMSGKVQIFHGQPIPGPYKQAVREQWLKKLFEIQKWIRVNGPTNVREIDLISIEELHEIRRIWVIEKHELEDSLPRIYREAIGESFPGELLDENLTFGEHEMSLLKEACNGSELHYQLIRELLNIERNYRNMARRAGLFEALEQGFRRNFYSGVEDATERALRLRTALNEAKEGKYVIRQQRSLFNNVEDKNRDTDHDN
jgi:DNA sulfur modification protein DndC